MLHRQKSILHNASINTKIKSWSIVAIFSAIRHMNSANYSFCCLLTASLTITWIIISYFHDFCVQTFSSSICMRTVLSSAAIAENRTSLSSASANHLLIDLTEKRLSTSTLILLRKMTSLRLHH